MADEVDVRDETVAHLEAQIEKSLGITEGDFSEFSESDNLAVLENSSDFQEFNEVEAREKVSSWMAGLLVGGFVLFSEKLEITKEQCATLGQVWGNVLGKWYPTAWLNRTEKAGDAVSEFEPEAVAFQETWGIFGNRVLEKFKKNSRKVPENSRNSRNSETPLDGDNSLNFPENSRNHDGVAFPKTMGGI